jgi:hypothetical protein
MQPSTTIRDRQSSVSRQRAVRRRDSVAPQARAGSLRTRVAEAFRRVAHGLEAKAAYASTVRFYRSGGWEWTRQLA